LDKVQSDSAYLPDPSAASLRARALARASYPAAPWAACRGAAVRVVDRAADRGAFRGVPVSRVTNSSTWYETLQQMADQSQRHNHLGQPIGESVGNWRPPPAPSRITLQGRSCRVEPLDGQRHTHQLWQANALDHEQRNWTYLGHGPYASLDEYAQWVASSAVTSDPLFFAVVGDAGQASGVASYLRIAPPAGSIEVGHINFSPLLQRTPAATEAMYLMMKYAFELGYRRYEWKCDALNRASRAAAQRLGLSFEGVFRQALVYKGRNRDTAWYAAIDKEWPALKGAFEAWLSADNFNERGEQRRRLSDLTRPLLHRIG
jgi:RimJ/RimL family protein N-acetyltransferase